MLWENFVNIVGVKKIVILGFGDENRQFLDWLIKVANFNSAQVLIADKKTPNLETLETLQKLGIDKQNCLFGENYLEVLTEKLEEIEFVFKSPGIWSGLSELEFFRQKKAEFDLQNLEIENTQNQKLEKEKDFYATIQNEIKIEPKIERILSPLVFFVAKFRTQIIGVTGTKGKTTTSSLIEHFLKHKIGNGKFEFDTELEAKNTNLEGKNTKQNLEENLENNLEKIDKLEENSKSNLENQAANTLRPSVPPLKREIFGSLQNLEISSESVGLKAKNENLEMGKKMKNLGNLEQLESQNWEEMGKLDLQNSQTLVEKLGKSKIEMAKNWENQKLEDEKILELERVEKLEQKQKLIRQFQNNQKIFYCGNTTGISPYQYWKKLDQKVDCKKFFVIELSSFQLQDLGYSRLSPKYAVITNFFIDHLDQHGNKFEYWKAKSNIFLHQRDGDFLISGEQFLAQIEHIGSQIYRELGNGKINEYYFDEPLDQEFIIWKEVINWLKNFYTTNLLGEHNWQNLILAMFVAEIVVANSQIIRDEKLQITNLESKKILLEKMTIAKINNQKLEIQKAQENTQNLDLKAKSENESVIWEKQKLEFGSQNLETQKEELEINLENISKINLNLDLEKAQETTENVGLTTKNDDLEEDSQKLESANLDFLDKNNSEKKLENNSTNTNFSQNKTGKITQNSQSLENLTNSKNTNQKIDEIKYIDIFGLEYQLENLEDNLNYKPEKITFYQILQEIIRHNLRENQAIINTFKPIGRRLELLRTLNLGLNLEEKSKIVEKLEIQNQINLEQNATNSSQNSLTNSQNSSQNNKVSDLFLDLQIQFFDDTAATEPDAVIAAIDALTDNYNKKPSFENQNQTGNEGKFQTRKHQNQTNSEQNSNSQNTYKTLESQQKSQLLWLIIAGKDKGGNLSDLADKIIEKTEQNKIFGLNLCGEIGKNLEVKIWQKLLEKIEKTCKLLDNLQNNKAENKLENYVNSEIEKISKNCGKIETLEQKLYLLLDFEKIEKIGNEDEKVEKNKAENKMENESEISNLNSQTQSENLENQLGNSLEIKTKTAQNQIISNQNEVDKILEIDKTQEKIEQNLSEEIELEVLKMLQKLEKLEQKIIILKNKVEIKIEKIEKQNPTKFKQKVLNELNLEQIKMKFTEFVKLTKLQNPSFFPANFGQNTTLNVVFSPSGSSYDEFATVSERSQSWQNLVKNL